MFVTYYIKLFRTGTDRHNGILMSLLLLVAQTIINDNLQNLKFYQRSSKNMTQNMMFCTKLKLLTPQKKLYSSFHCFKFFVSADCFETWKFTDLRKLSTLIQPELFQFLSSCCTYLWETHNLKNISKVQSTTGWEKNVPAKCLCHFLKWRYFSDISIN